MTEPLISPTSRVLSFLTTKATSTSQWMDPTRRTWRTTKEGALQELVTCVVGERSSVMEGCHAHIAKITTANAFIISNKRLENRQRRELECRKLPIVLKADKT